MRGEFVNGMYPNFRSAEGFYISYATDVTKTGDGTTASFIMAPITLSSQYGTANADLNFKIIVMSITLNKFTYVVLPS